LPAQIKRNDQPITLCTINKQQFGIELNITEHNESGRLLIRLLNKQGHYHTRFIAVDVRSKNGDHCHQNNWCQSVLFIIYCC